MSDIYTDENIELDVKEKYPEEGKRGPQTYRIPFYLLDNNSFSEWMSTSQHRIWLRLYIHTVRGPMENALGLYIYNNYYKKGIIAVSYKQETIAKELNIKSKSFVSRHINEMIEAGIIKKHEDSFYGRQIFVYELGTHDMGPNRHETLHSFIYFTKLEASIELGKRFS